MQTLQFKFNPVTQTLETSWGQNWTRKRSRKMSETDRLDLLICLENLILRRKVLSGNFNNYSTNSLMDRRTSKGLLSHTTITSPIRYTCCHNLSPQCCPVSRIGQGSCVETNNRRHVAPAWRHADCGMAAHAEQTTTWSSPFTC